jgi:hypothetical protein
VISLVDVLEASVAARVSKKQLDAFHAVIAALEASLE